VCDVSGERTLCDGLSSEEPKFSKVRSTVILQVNLSCEINFENVCVICVMERDG